MSGTSYGLNIYNHAHSFCLAYLPPSQTAWLCDWPSPTLHLHPLYHCMRLDSHSTSRLFTVYLHSDPSMLYPYHLSHVRVVSNHINVAAGPA
ncbi:hypothetical protein A0H81_11245 [Grifola frondosa]|uniref:Uncharacterized protein n=1 Tax=Grifola frondosa TaxID=5627 RepID=A0A1C7LVW1_GRIFR|nr:hypothetical protein A0H81_11245 [Grifola frondosa]